MGNIGRHHPLITSKAVLDWVLSSKQAALSVLLVCPSVTVRAAWATVLAWAIHTSMASLGSGDALFSTATSSSSSSPEEGKVGAEGGDDASVWSDAPWRLMRLST